MLLRTNSGQERLIAIDALRGLAALIIVLFHARPLFWIGIGETWQQYKFNVDLNAWLGYATAPLYFGGLAVELFFVISGYCIHRRGARELARNKNAKLDLIQYSERRFWRIYPVYFVALCITAFIDSYIRLFHPALIPREQNNSLFTFLMSIISLQGLAAPMFGSNTVFWTLALEIHFYIIYPLLFYISRRYGPIKALTVTLCASLCYVLLDQIFNISSLLSYRGSGLPIFLPYWFIWATGFYIAEVEAGRAPIPKGFWLAVFLSSIVTIFASLREQWNLNLFSTALAFGGLVYWSITPTGESFWRCGVGHLLASIGIFSFSVYAIHRPTLLAIKAIIAPDGKVFVSLLPTAVGAILAVGAGWLLFIAVEKWTLKSFPIQANHLVRRFTTRSKK